jgi:hypothetical protein
MPKPDSYFYLRLRYKAAMMVAKNWRLRKRLPRLTVYARKVGLIGKNDLM